MEKLNLPGKKALCFASLPGWNRSASYINRCQAQPLNPADIAWVVRRLRPHPYGCYLSTQRLLNLIAGRGIKVLPRTYIDCIKPFYSDFNGTKDRVKADAGWNYLTIETGHDAMVSAPQELAKLLLQA